MGSGPPTFKLSMLILCLIVGCSVASVIRYPNVNFLLQPDNLGSLNEIQQSPTFSALKSGRSIQGGNLDKNLLFMLGLLMPDAKGDDFAQLRDKRAHKTEKIETVTAYAVPTDSEEEPIAVADASKKSGRDPKKAIANIPREEDEEEEVEGSRDKSINAQAMAEDAFGRDTSAVGIAGGKGHSIVHAGSPYGKGNSDAVSYSPGGQSQATAIADKGSATAYAMQGPIPHIDFSELERGYDIKLPRPEFNTKQKQQLVKKEEEDEEEEEEEEEEEKEEKKPVTKPSPKKVEDKKGGQTPSKPTVKKVEDDEEDYENEDDGGFFNMMQIFSRMTPRSHVIAPKPKSEKKFYVVSRDELQELVREVVEEKLHIPKKDEGVTVVDIIGKSSEVTGTPSKRSGRVKRSPQDEEEVATPPAEETAPAAPAAPAPAGADGGRGPKATALSKSKTGKSQANAISRSGDAEAVALNGTSASATALTSSKSGTSNAISNSGGDGGSKSLALSKGSGNSTGTSVSRGKGDAQSAAVAMQGGHSRADSDAKGGGNATSSSLSNFAGNTTSNAHSSKGSSSAQAVAKGTGSAKSNSVAGGKDGKSKSLATSKGGDVMANSRSSKSGESHSIAGTSGKGHAISNSVSGKGASRADSFSEHGDSVATAITGSGEQIHSSEEAPVEEEEEIKDSQSHRARKKREVSPLQTQTVALA